MSKEEGVHACKAEWAERQSSRAEGGEDAGDAPTERPVPVTRLAMEEREVSWGW